jgi:hypothetical protein
MVHGSPWGPLHSCEERTKSVSIEIQRGRSISRQSDSSTRELSFANEGQLLLVSKASVDELNRRVAAALHAGEVDCFSWWFLIFVLFT